MNFHEDPFIKSLITRLTQSGVLGLALVGSYARGQNTAHSDVDVDIFVESLSREANYILRNMDGHLVSLKYLTIEQERTSLTHPEKAIWAVPGLRQMVILTDDTGSIAGLKQAAQDFNWQKIQPAADEYASEELMGCAEEVHKIVGGLKANDESKVLYAVWGLFSGLANAVTVQRGMLMESENRYFDVIQQTIGIDHPWTKSFRLALGADIIADAPAYITRGKAALDLYKHTAQLFQNIIPEKHRDVIENTLQLLDTL
ncbi:MAG: nucleotidyltransferase domain-containing protein [Anaerolineales bacterium]|nr:nucleotidyltransferase domain-containing protein [Anaerolineales bacterium]